MLSQGESGLVGQIPKSLEASDLGSGKKLYIVLFKTDGRKRSALSDFTQYLFTSVDCFCAVEISLRTILKWMQLLQYCARNYVKINTILEYTASQIRCVLHRFNYGPNTSVSIATGPRRITSIQGRTLVPTLDQRKADVNIFCPESSRPPWH